MIFYKKKEFGQVNVLVVGPTHKSQSAQEIFVLTSLP
jgi:hypothetical protein